MTEDARPLILVGEDDATMRRILRTLLEIDGYQVVNIPDTLSETAVVELITQRRPQVLLLDVHLSEINGIDLLRRLRADPSLSDMRVLMVSGMDLRDECRAAGANGFLLKPYMPDELFKALKG